MFLYSAALLVGLMIASPWWLLRMATTKRYREGLGQRLGEVPYPLQIFVRRFRIKRRVIWVHAVSVGEVLAATRLIAELEAALGDDWRVVVSTTTRTGQALARERFGAERVFYYPLDLRWAVRAYLVALRPAMLVLMESELWPRMLHECRKDGVPVAVVNARVSDRSFRRGMRVRAVWGQALRMVSLWLAQSEEDARRLVAMGADATSVKVSGNLKFDVRANQSPMLDILKPLLERRTLVLGGSLLDPEEQSLIDIWWQVRSQSPEAVLILAPRHPDRFEAAIQVAGSLGGGTIYRASELAKQSRTQQPLNRLQPLAVIVLDTIGDLAILYQLADVAFVGGSLVDRGGHNPLEPAQFGVPVVMGPHFQNFRGIVGAMQAADGIRIVSDTVELRKALTELLQDRASAQAMGRRGQQVFEEQQGATGRTVAALLAKVRGE